MENNDILSEYLKKFKEKPPLIIEFPYENEQYGIIMEWAIDKNEKLTYKKVSELIDKLNIETGVVFDNKKENEEENKKDMADIKKIKNLLKKYGASDYEIENFIEELEADDFNPYSKDVISKLRETPEGKAIIRDMPKTDKQELIKKIKEHLGNND